MLSHSAKGTNYFKRFIKGMRLHQFFWTGRFFREAASSKCATNRSERIWSCI